MRTATLLAALVLGAVLAIAQTAGVDTGILVKPTGSEPSRAGSPEHFTGSVRVDDPFHGTGDARIRGATVTFSPGARTAWHVHPLGQTLIVTAGVGRVQHWDGLVQEIRPGDTVWIPPGVKHWHGASATVGMRHIAISEALDGSTVEWREKVSDEQYEGQPSTPEQ